MNELGQLLKKLRGYNSLRTIAEKTNGKVSYSYLNILEKGVNPATGQPTKPNPEVLKALSDVYNYCYDELMRVAGYIQEGSEDKINKLFDDYSRLSKDEKKKLIDMMLKDYEQ